MQYISAHSLIGTATCATFQETYMSRSNICDIGTPSTLIYIHTYIYIYIYIYVCVCIVTTGYLALYLKYLSTILQCWLPGGG